MIDFNLPASDVQALDGVAEMLAWLGWDRAADAIYAMIYPETVVSMEGTVGQWNDVFQS